MGLSGAVWCILEVTVELGLAFIVYIYIFPQEIGAIWGWASRKTRTRRPGDTGRGDAGLEKGPRDS